MKKLKKPPLFRRVGILPPVCVLALTSILVPRASCLGALAAGPTSTASCESGARPEVSRAVFTLSSDARQAALRLVADRIEASDDDSRLIGSWSVVDVVCRMVSGSKSVMDRNVYAGKLDFSYQNGFSAVVVHKDGSRECRNSATGSYRTTSDGHLQIDKLKTRTSGDRTVDNCDYDDKGPFDFAYQLDDHGRLHLSVPAIDGSGCENIDEILEKTPDLTS